ncbi:MAG: glycosyltransferase family 2 protein, partial [Coleofasciculaceae cyanobacterium]
RLTNSIPATPNIPHQIIIVNNSPDDHTIQQLQSPSVQILTAKTNLGFGQGCNLGLNWIYTQNPKAIVWIINPDTYLPKETLEKVPSFFATHPELSLLGTYIYTPDGDIWFAGGQFIPKLGEIISSTSPPPPAETGYLTCDWVSGCSLLVNLDHFPTCPQFDPAYFLYYEDFDFCRRYASLGHLIGITNQFAVIHQASAITNRNPRKKFVHSTYSYLLTLERYTNQKVLLLRLTRVTIFAFLLLVIKPQTALGKLMGVSNYLLRVLANCLTKFW